MLRSKNLELTDLISINYLCYTKLYIVSYQMKGSP